MGPVLGGQKGFQFLQSREKVEDYFDKSLPNLALKYVLPLTSSNDSKIEVSAATQRTATLS
jgi:hypothetical protein